MLCVLRLKLRHSAAKFGCTGYAHVIRLIWSPLFRREIISRGKFFREDKRDESTGVGNEKKGSEWFCSILSHLRTERETGCFLTHTLPMSFIKRHAAGVSSPVLSRSTLSWLGSKTVPSRGWQAIKVWLKTSCCSCLSCCSRCQCNSLVFYSRFLSLLFTIREWMKKRTRKNILCGSLVTLLPFFRSPSPTLFHDVWVARSLPLSHHSIDYEICSVRWHIHREPEEEGEKN